jgi:hypothetical protein
MRKFMIALLLASFACSIQACTTKGSNILPTSNLVKPLDSVGGGPGRNCPPEGCPDPTPTP